ncbi:aldehyde dehydrogenase (NADP(+)), partial [Xanthomonas oryzae pv. oryzae]
MNDTNHSSPTTTAEILLGGRWQRSGAATGSFRAANPATGEPIGPHFPISGADDVEAAVVAAQAVAA